MLPGEARKQLAAPGGVPCASPLGGRFPRALAAYLVVTGLGTACERSPHGAQETQRMGSVEAQGRAAGAPAAKRETPRELASPLPRLLVPRLEPGAAFVFDGLLSEPAWAQAARTGRFVDVATGGANRRFPVNCEARLLWDERGLLLAFEVSDSDVRGGFPEHAVDPHLWTRDTVELMIDPDGDGDNRDYYEVQVNPQNLVFDSLFDGYGRPRPTLDGPFGHQQWESKVDSGVRVLGTLDDDRPDRGYTVELRLPWASLQRARRAPPAEGDEWRMNLYAMQDNGGVAWSPILGQGSFHYAPRFGTVIFSGRVGSAQGLPVPQQ